MNKKLISLITAAAMVMPMFTMLHTALADSATTPEVTVVGKRITGDDTYFEISLEVNGDYEDYSAVGVVLRYDPDYIVPAESWEDGAGELNLSGEGATTWGTRRALPTIGKDTWSTQTALAYEDYETDPVSGSKKLYGYLYLGAEYPGTVPDDTNPSASPGAAAPAAAATTPSPTPNGTPDPDIYQNPVVAVRFMYKNTAAAGSDDAQVAASRLAQKTELVDKWLDTAGSGANSWDGANWPNNEILTLASDTISGTSPAQYPYAYYRSNLEQYAYMHTWPVVPTADPAGTPLPLNMQLDIVKEIGADVDAAHQLTASNIEICLGEGKSAKETGGLKLSDIFVIMFFDWDDSLLGTLTAGVGVDATEAVNNYVEEKFIHPDLRSSAISPPYTTIAAAGVDTWKERQYSYRGEYPYSGPNSTDPTLPGGTNSIAEEIDDGSGTGTMMTNPNAGSNYPLTNKLDYTLGGKNIDPKHPFANGWTQVLPKSVIYNVADFNSQLECDAQPKGMSDTWTALSSSDTFTRAKFDSTGQLLDDTGAVAASQTLPTLISFDFSDITADDLANSDGNLYVKAVYEAGEMLNGIVGTNYATVGDYSFDTLLVTSESTTYSISFKYGRINSSGYGVDRAHKPGVQMTIQEVSALKSTPLSVLVDNKDIIDVILTPTDAVEELGYKLKETYYTNDVITGQDRSDGNEYGTLAVGGPAGKGYIDSVQDILERAYTYGVTPTTTTWLKKADYLTMKVSQDIYGTGYTKTAHYKLGLTPMIELVKESIAAGQDYHTLTGYQIQYALLQDGSSGYYVTNAVAKAWCEQYPVLIETLCS